MELFHGTIKRFAEDITNNGIDIQYVFKTEKAISALRLEKVEEV